MRNEVCLARETGPRSVVGIGEEKDCGEERRLGTGELERMMNLWDIVSTRGLHIPVQDHAGLGNAPHGQAALQSLGTTVAAKAENAG